MQLSQPHSIRYDYIVVGAGSAGATLAARLSEDPSVSVLLLEAGPDYRAADTPVEMRSPNFDWIGDGQRFPQYQWRNLMAQRTTAQQPALYLRGRGMGGSSAINAMAAIRGVPEDFDRWAELGCRGWSFADVLPSFNRLEDDLDFGDRPYHGRGGPIPISRPSLDTWQPLHLALRDAALALGYGWADDHNAPESTGVSPWAMNVRNGQRVSTNDAYLEPARSRPNLTIAGDALVDRVELEGRRARGVRVLSGEQWQAIEGREIILCAGAIHSPAILLRSGIGPAEDLRRLGVAPLVDVPGVGQNLGEHPLIMLTLQLLPGARAASLHARQSMCIVRYSSGLVGAGRNDMQIISAQPVGVDEDAYGRGGIGASAVQSFSRGRIFLTTSDPQTDPVVDFRLLTDERDLVRMRDGARRLFDLARHGAIAGITARVQIDEAGRSLDDIQDERQLDEWLQARCGDYVHAVGTCRMGPLDDPQSVVDVDGRVKGVDGLRVVDASIMPEVPRANTHLTTVMIAEHIAARMKRETERAFISPGMRQPPNGIVSSAQQPARFPDLRSAGRDLAAALEEFTRHEDVLVLGLVLGGVPVAHEVAEHLGVPLDFVIIRRLLAPDGPGSQVCAVNVAGSLVVDEEVMARPAVPESPLDYFVSDALEGLARRARTCRGDRPAVEIAQKTILLVDCGIRTGLTMRAAIRALRTKGPARIIAATPVASPDSREVIESIADGVVCLRWAHPFGHVGMWYRDFSRAADRQVSEMLR